MITSQKITDAVSDLCREASFTLPKDVMQALEKAFSHEKKPLVQDVYKLFKQNAETAKEKKVPLCQDTGTAVVFVEKGDRIKLSGRDLIKAINKGVANGYKKYYLRKSITEDPLRRKNTGDNTPAVIHLLPKRGKNLKITLLQKGGGAENLSRIKMLNPGDGQTGVFDFIVDTVKRAGSKGCPPYTVGVGIGGNFETCPHLAKKALIRNLTKSNKDPYYAKMEDEVLKKINKLGIGPQGFGGKVTAIAVNIEIGPCHIASLPVAVNIECAMHRHASVTLKG